jgi:excisionase family DNA binding protein
MKKPTTSVDVPRQQKMTSNAIELNDDSLHFLNLKEVANIMRVTPSSIYRLVEKRALRFYRVARKLLFKKKDIADFIDRSKTEELTYVPVPYEDVQD